MRDERQYVFDTIGALLSGSTHQWDWDFMSSRLHNPALDQIRRRALMVRLPLTAGDAETLKALLNEVEGFTDPAQPKPWRMEAGLLCGLAAGGVLWWVSFLPGGGLFQNLPLLLMPAVAGILVVSLRNRKKSVGFHDPDIIARNKRGRA